MENEFIELCKKGNLDQIKEFYNKHKEININAESDIAFQWLCYNRHLNGAQWLLSIQNNK